MPRLKFENVRCMMRRCEEHPGGGSNKRGVVVTCFAPTAQCESLIVDDMDESGGGFLHVSAPGFDEIGYANEVRCKHFRERQPKAEE